MKCRSSPQLKFYHLLPAAVLMPAPCKKEENLHNYVQGIHGSALTVNAIICLLSLTHRARSEILRSRSSGGSKYSLVSSSLRAVLAMVWERYRWIIDITERAGCRIELPQETRRYKICKMV